jgi:hypothetical protein
MNAEKSHAGDAAKREATEIQPVGLSLPRTYQAQFGRTSEKTTVGSRASGEGRC